MKKITELVVINRNNNYKKKKRKDYNKQNQLMINLKSWNKLIKKITIEFLSAKINIIIRNYIS